jgi:hypothetical protein
MDLSGEHESVRYSPKLSHKLSAIEHTSGVVSSVCQVQGKGLGSSSLISDTKALSMMAAYLVLVSKSSSSVVVSGVLPKKTDFLAMSMMFVRKRETLWVACAG